MMKKYLLIIGIVSTLFGCDEDGKKNEQETIQTNNRVSERLNNDPVYQMLKRKMEDFEEAPE